MFFRKPTHQCPCGATNVQLSRRGLCANCEWAYSEAIGASEKIQEMDHEIEKQQEALDDMANRLQAMKLERQIVIEDNIVIKASLARAYRKIRDLETVSD